MAEILLSFFAVIGMLFLIIYLCDYFFYRNFHPVLSLIVDTRKMTEQECIESFELITSLRQTTSGKAAIGNLVVLVADTNEIKAKLSREYMQIFRIPGEIYVASETINLSNFSF